MLVNKKRILFFALVLLLVFIDFLSKWLVVLFFLKKIEIFDFSRIVVIPYLVEIILFFNNGCVFGLGNNVLYVRLLLIFIRFLILAFLTLNIIGNRFFMKNNYYQISFIFAYAGCIGNLIDTLFYWKKNVGFDGVIDWIRIPFFNYIFNLADVYVFLSLLFLILSFFRIDKIKND